MDTDVEYSIKVNHLTKYYGRKAAIQDVSFSLKKGEIVGFLGPNGSGKSTTMRILTGLLTANSGSAFICGIPVSTHPEEIKRKIGYMPENNPLPLDMRVGEYLRFRGKLKEISRRKLRQRIDFVLELCELGRARRRVIGTLSKGYRQRIGIAEAILSDPEVAIMDEPTIGLDPHQILKIRDLIGSLKGRMSVIISSHILPEIELTCDRVIIINQGFIVAKGTPRQLREEFLPDSVYHLEMKGSIEALRGKIKSINSQLSLLTEGSCEFTGLRKITLSGPWDGHFGENLIADLAGQPEIRLFSLVHQEPTLEDIFLAATKRSWEVLSDFSDDSAQNPSNLRGEPAVE